MKRDMIFGKLLILLAAAAFMPACNDFDPESVPYEDDTTTPFVPTPPSIDPAWGLVEIANAGQHGKNVFVYKDKKYDALFTRSLGWNGGDGVLTTELPDGNIFWSFNDSFYGIADPVTRARGSSNFPRNSIMVQKGTMSGDNRQLGETDDDLVWLADYVQTDDPDAERYYHARTHLRNPDAAMTNEDIQKGEVDNDYVYWAGDATYYDDPSLGPVMQMVWNAVDLTEGDGSMINYQKAVVKYSLRGEPGDATYMSIVDQKHRFLLDPLGYGSTMYDGDPDHIYLYTTEQDGAYGCFTLVARTDTRDLAGGWSYYIRGTDNEFQWQSTFPTKEETKRSYIMTQPGSMPWVFKKGDWYYMTYESFPFGRPIYICRSENPWGPFTDHKLLFTLPPTLDKLGDPYPNNWYMVNLHTGLSREGELVFSTNSDAANFWDNFNRKGSADFYRPYFFRVFNWESLYEEDTEE